ncbi:MAG: response regulator transcription factor [Actinomycetota bacterium]|nr:response regulator transcription factor [Actinomycetota bacterium]
METTAALLVSEPEPVAREFLERHLADDGFQLLPPADDARPDLVLLADAAALEEWRQRDVPVIVLGGPEADAVDRVRAFDRGCDDFLARPFLYDELLARIRAVLRRTSAAPSERVEAGPITIDRATRRVKVGGRAVTLAAKEYDLLLHLAGDPTRVFTKEQLLRDVWGFRSQARTRTLDSHASRLRRKLNAAGDIDCVINEWGVGYRLLTDEPWAAPQRRAVA